MVDGEKYDFADIVHSFIENGDRNKLKNAETRVKNRIKEYELKRWQHTCMLYPELKVYMKVVNTIKPIIWWTYAQSHPHLVTKIAAVVALLCGNEPRGMQCNFDSKFCRLCECREKDDIEHILFRCSTLAVIRQDYYRKLIHSMPQGMRCSYEDMDVNNKIVFILSGMLTEFDDVMTHIVVFIYEMYRERKRRYSMILPIM